MADKELRAHLKVTGENAAKAGLKGFGDEAAKTGDKVGDLAKQTDHLAESAAKAEAEYKDLIKVFQETGDLDKKALNRAKREMRFFDGLKAQLEAELKQAAIEVAAPSGAGAAGGIIGEGLAKGLGAAIAAGGPYLIGALAGVAAASMPFIGGVIASAVVGGVGMGGIAGGLALAAQDTRVKDSAEQLADTASQAFQAAGQEFVLPAIDALQMLEQASIDVAAGMGQGFRAIAPTLKPLTEGVIGFVEELLPDLIAGFNAAKPVIRAIANELPDIGSALGDFIGMISEDTDGAVMAFAALSDMIQVTLRWTGGLIQGLTKTYEFAVDAAISIGGFLEELYKSFVLITPLAGVLSSIFGGTVDWAEQLRGALDKSNDASGDFAGGLDRVATEADRAEQELEDMKDAIDNLFGVTMNLDKAVLAYKQSLVDSRKELEDGTRTLDLNTQAGRDNMESALNRIGIIDQLRDSESKSTLGVVEANKRYEERIKVLRDDLLQMGYNKKAVEELITKYLAVPNAINVQFNLKAGGDAAAWAAFRASERKGDRATFSQQFEERAAGGPTRAGRTYLVGENGPELWSENANGFITPAGPTAALMSGRSGGSAMGQPAITRAPSGGGDPSLEGLFDYLWPGFIKRAQITGWPAGASSA